MSGGLGGAGPAIAAGVGVVGLVAGIAGFLSVRGGARDPTAYIAALAGVVAGLAGLLAGEFFDVFPLVAAGGATGLVGVGVLTAAVVALDERTESDAGH